MTKKEMLNEILADMKSDRQRENFMARGMKKSKEFIEKVYRLWKADIPENNKFYHAVINA